MRYVAFLTACLLALAPTVSRAQERGEQAFVEGLMEAMNPLSFRFNREVCGYILRDTRGNYRSTKASWGGHASCATPDVGRGQIIVASWHTHAAWLVEYDSEVPSLIDIESDMAQGINGWIGTPGGRLWFVDGSTGNAHQACGQGCLPVDPGFVPEHFGPVAQSYTLESLSNRFGRR